MNRIERIKARLKSTVPYVTPGEWYHEDAPYLIEQIKQISAERDALSRNYSNKMIEYDDLFDEATRIRVERDAAIADAKLNAMCETRCFTCKWLGGNGCQLSTDDEDGIDWCNWQWRGLPNTTTETP